MDKLVLEESGEECFSRFPGHSASVTMTPLSIVVRKQQQTTVNKQGRLSSNETLFTATGCGWDLLAGCLLLTSDVEAEDNSSHL